MSDPLGRAGDGSVPEAAGPAAAGPRVGGWVPLFVGGWLVSQVVGALAYVLTAPLFLVSGDASGVAASGVLQDVALASSAGAPLVALAVWQVPVWATQLATVALATTARRRSLRDDLGLRFRPIDLLIGACGGVVTQVLIGVVYAVFGVDAEGPARQVISKGHGVAGLIGLLVLLALAAPFVEELLFRGLLQRGLAGRLPRPAALVITAVVFAAVHFQPVQFPGLLVAGLVFGWLAMRYDRLGPAIVAHMCFNASTVLYLALR